jgi:hypothetical protein
MSIAYTNPACQVSGLRLSETVTKILGALRGSSKTSVTQDGAALVVHNGKDGLERYDGDTPFAQAVFTAIHTLWGADMTAGDLFHALMALETLHGKPLVGQGTALTAQRLWELRNLDRFDYRAQALVMAVLTGMQSGHCDYSMNDIIRYGAEPTIEVASGLLDLLAAK